ncbi:hypothetical protein Q9966_011648 [Columba livia]|nr:hypothetical protein Q9966_011648 [Columba livia]
MQKTSASAIFPTGITLLERILHHPKAFFYNNLILKLERKGMYGQNNGYHETPDEFFLPVSERDGLGNNTSWLGRKLRVQEKANGFDSVVPSFIRKPDDAVRSMPVLSVARKDCARRRFSLLENEETLWGKESLENGEDQNRNFSESLARLGPARYAPKITGSLMQESVQMIDSKDKEQRIRSHQIRNASLGSAYGKLGMPKAEVTTVSNYGNMCKEDAFVELYGNSMRPLFDFSWISLKTILSLVLVGACITLGAYLGHK